MVNLETGTAHVCAPSCACVAACGSAREDWAAYWEDHDNVGGILSEIGQPQYIYRPSIIMEDIANPKGATFYTGGKIAYVSLEDA